MLSDDPVDLRGQGGGGQPGRQPLGRGDEALEFLEPVEDDGQPHWFTPGPTSNRKVALPQKSHPNAPTILTWPFHVSVCEVYLKTFEGVR